MFVIIVLVLVFVIGVVCLTWASHDRRMALRGNMLEQLERREPQKALRGPERAVRAFSREPWYEAPPMDFAGIYAFEREVWGHTWEHIGWPSPEEASAAPKIGKAKTDHDKTLDGFTKLHNQRAEDERRLRRAYLRQISDIARAMGVSPSDVTIDQASGRVAIRTLNNWTVIQHPGQRPAISAGGGGGAYQGTVSHWQACKICHRNVSVAGRLYCQKCIKGLEQEERAQRHTVVYATTRPCEVCGVADGMVQMHNGLAMCRPCYNAFCESHSAWQEKDKGWTVQSQVYTCVNGCRTFMPLTEGQCFHCWGRPLTCAERQGARQSVSHYVDCYCHEAEQKRAGTCQCSACKAGLFPAEKEPACKNCGQPKDGLEGDYCAPCLATNQILLLCKVCGNRPANHPGACRIKCDDPEPIMGRRWWCPMCGGVGNSILSVNAMTCHGCKIPMIENRYS